MFSKGLYEKWLMEEAQRVFEDKVKKYSKKLGVYTSIEKYSRYAHR
jgi:hypothetical protein